MGLFTFLLVIQTLVALAMVTVILMQRSEGGGLTGGSPSGLMTARGAADFLTRSTAILATIFVVLSIVLAALAARAGGPRVIDPASLQRPSSPVPQQGPTQPIPGAGGGVLPTGPTSPQQGAAPGSIPGAGAPGAPAQAPVGIAAPPAQAPGTPANKQ
jgi:preprotein translocase subunit SecG